MTSAAPLIRLDNASLSYRGRPVLENLQLTIHRGERIALVGKSGAGKSTLLRHLRRQLADLAAWCPQDPGLVPALSTYHNIYMGNLHRHSSLYNLLNLCRPLRRPLQQVTQLARQLDLEPQLMTAVGQLSGGQQQRTSIGRALIQQCPVFLGDEPVSNIDEYQAERLLALICERHDTAVLALHDTGLALRTCQRIIALRHGGIHLDSPARAVSPADLAAVYR